MEIDKKKVGEGVLTEEEEIYRENILDHYKNPQNFGALEEYSFKHKEFNPLCGDELELFVGLNGGNVIKNVRFQGQGCAISQASMSLLSEKLQDKRLDDIKKITKDEVLGMLGISIGMVRMKCALLSLKTLHNGVEGFSKKNE